jgi:hypothetical protein
MTGVSDSIFWLIGGAIGLLALWILYWSLLRDRARGRRRCPKCWYDMSGTSAPDSPGNLVCSECGYAAKRERKLFKTRRRKRWACIGLFVALAAWLTVKWPQIVRDGVETIVPTTALIAISPWLDHTMLFAPANTPIPVAGIPTTFAVWPNSAAVAVRAPILTLSQRLASELHQRALEDELAGWQWRWMVRNLSAQPGWPPWTLSADLSIREPGSNLVFVQFDIIRGSSFPWLENSELRFRFESGNEDRTAETIRFAGTSDSQARVSRDPWGDATAAYRAATEASPLQPRMTVERRQERQENAPWIVIWSDRVSAVNVKSRTNSTPQPRVDPALTERIGSIMHLFVNAEGVGIRWSRTSKAEEITMPTLAMEFELVHDGRVVAKTGAWWTTEVRTQKSGMGLIAVPGFHEVLWEGQNPIDPAAMNAPDSGRWEVRVTGSKELALRDIRSKEYWEGTLTIPVFWYKASQQWISE